MMFPMQKNDPGGTDADPHGRRCLLCPFVHKIGGYQMSLQEVHKALKSDFSQTAEWLSCLRLLVIKINNESLTPTTRLRGSTKTKVEAAFAMARKKALIVIREEALIVDDKYRAKRKTTWDQQNPGKKPSDDNLIVRWITLPGEAEPCECVCAKRLDADEFDVTIQTKTGIQQQETVDDGSCTLRDKQQEDKFEKIAAATVGTIAAAKGQEVAVWRDYAPAPKAEEEEKNEEEEPQEAEGVDGDASEEEVEPEDDLVAGILATVFKKAPAAKAVAAPNTSAKAATKPKASAKPPVKQPVKAQSSSASTTAGTTKSASTVSGTTGKSADPTPSRRVNTAPESASVISKVDADEA